MNLRSLARRESLGSLGRLGLAGAALVALPLTTGCQTRTGLAASVGETKIKTSQLTAVTARSSAALAATGQTVPPGQQQALQRGVLNLLVRDALLEQVGKARGVTASPAELVAERASEAKQAGGEKSLVTQAEQGGVSATDLVVVVREKVLITKLQAQFGSSDSTAFGKALTGAAQKIGVRVNPRFGRWDAKALTIVGAPNDLSSTAIKK